MEGSPGLEKTLKDYYKSLYSSFGPQGWWPGRTRFEVIIGAILTQNTAWGNVEKAIRNLKREKFLTPEKMRGLPHAELAALLRPAGYFNIKAGRVGNFLDHLFENYGGRLGVFLRKDQAGLRKELLGINGIGPETADSILLYAANYPEFVVDAYTRRIFSRHGISREDMGYEELKSIFMDNLPADADFFNEYHALIVRTGKEYCRNRAPRCSECPLYGYLPDALRFLPGY